MKKSKEEFAQKLAELFPEKEQALKEHYKDYGEMLGHIFFSDEISVPLFELLLKEESGKEIKAYCDFIEEMWKNGDEQVVNVVDVTILEKLSDDMVVWKHFGKNISDEFIRYINNELLVQDLMMQVVDRLEYNRGK